MAFKPKKESLSENIRFIFQYLHGSKFYIVTNDSGFRLCTGKQKRDIRTVWIRASMLLVNVIRASNGLLFSELQVSMAGDPEGARREQFGCGSGDGVEQLVISYRGGFFLTCAGQGV